MRARLENIGRDPGRSYRIEERRLARFDAPWHFHPELELTLIIEGRGRRFAGDDIAPYAEGDFVLLGPNLPHFWQTEPAPPPGRRSHALVLQFSPEFLGSGFWERPECRRAASLLARASRGLRFSGARARAAAERFRRLPGLAPLEGLLGVLALLDELGGLAAAGQRHAVPLAGVGYSPSLDPRREARLARVFSHVGRRFREEITLRETAKVAAMSPEAFCRYFKRATGRTFSTFINELRVDHAARLLQETSLGIATISVECGYATLSSFNRRFRERMDCTPREYRREFAGP